MGPAGRLECNKRLHVEAVARGDALLDRINQHMHFSSPSCRRVADFIFVVLGGSAHRTVDAPSLDAALHAAGCGLETSEAAALVAHIAAEVGGRARTEQPAITAFELERALRGRWRARAGGAAPRHVRERYAHARRVIGRIDERVRATAAAGATGTPPRIRTFVTRVAAAVDPPAARSRAAASEVVLGEEALMAALHCALPGLELDRDDADSLMLLIDADADGYARLGELEHALRRHRRDGAAAAAQAAAEAVVGRHLDAALLRQGWRVQDFDRQLLASWGQQERANFGAAGSVGTEHAQLGEDEAHTALQMAGAIAITQAEVDEYVLHTAADCGSQVAICELGRAVRRLRRARATTAGADVEEEEEEEEEEEGRTGAESAASAGADGRHTALPPARLQPPELRLQAPPDPAQTKSTIQVGAAAAEHPPGQQSFLTQSAADTATAPSDAMPATSAGAGAAITTSTTTVRRGVVLRILRRVDRLLGGSLRQLSLPKDEPFDEEQFHALLLAAAPAGASNGSAAALSQEDVDTLVTSLGTDSGTITIRAFAEAMLRSRRLLARRLGLRLLCSAEVVAAAASPGSLARSAPLPSRSAARLASRCRQSNRLADRHTVSRPAALGQTLPRATGAKFPPLTGTPRAAQDAGWWPFNDEQKVHVPEHVMAARLSSKWRGAVPTPYCKVHWKQRLENAREGNSCMRERLARWSPERGSGILHKDVLSRLASPKFPSPSRRVAAD